METVRSHVSAMAALPSNHMHQVLSTQSEIRSIDPNKAANDEDLLAQIGYKQELVRSYSTLQVFGIAFSIMSLLPSQASVLGLGLEGGPVSLVWGWLVAGFFIFCLGISLSELGSAIPTSGGIYYYSSYYAPDSIRVPLSFIVGISNTLALCGGVCSITYGAASEILAAVYMSNEDFVLTTGKEYGVFAAAVIVEVVVCCLATRRAALLQAISIYVNLFLIVLYFIALPIGASKNGFNDGAFIFGKFENLRTWSPGWSFMLSLMPAIWTIGAFDSPIHMAEEAKNPGRSVSWGILGSIGACWVLGFFIYIVTAACIKDGDIERIMDSDTGFAMAQIIRDALGNKWAIAMMALISFAQMLMGISLLIAMSRQVFAFARDHGLPFVYNFVKYVNPRIKVPVRATMFAGVLSLILGLLILINTTAANALFSLGVVGNIFAWGTPIFLRLLPVGKSRFVPGPFYTGPFWSPVFGIISTLWILFVIVLAMFPDSKTVDKETMNYTCVVNMGIWILSLLYFFFYGYKHYHGPVSNLDEDDVHTTHIDQAFDEKT